MVMFVNGYVSSMTLSRSLMSQGYVLSMIMFCHWLFFVVKGLFFVNDYVLSRVMLCQ